MEFTYDREVRENALAVGENVSGVFIPGKKAFFLYRAKVPAVVIGVVFVVLTAASLVLHVAHDVPLSGIWLYIAGSIASIPVAFVNYFVQKKLFVRRAYYLTDKRILLVGGLFHTKYQTLNYRFIGAVSLKRSLFSKPTGLHSYSIGITTNLNKRLSVKFFTRAGYTLSFIENGSEAYKLITEKTAF